jgi:hypothetical protein
MDSEVMMERVLKGWYERVHRTDTNTHTYDSYLEITHLLRLARLKEHCRVGQGGHDRHNQINTAPPAYSTVHASTVPW